jgi:Bacterial SH3 domain
MRKALAILLSLLFVITAAYAQDDPSRTVETIYGIITVDNSYVRVGPDFAYDAIASLPLNFSVVILGRSGDFINRWDGRQWLQIEFNGGTGWLYARLVRTSRSFNSIPPIGRLLPRDANGRVPEGFDLSSDLCSQWQGAFTQSGDFMAGDTELTVTYPTLQGATVYNIIAISPTGFRTPFESTTGTGVIDLRRLPNTAGTYTWRVAPYYSTSSNRRSWQQVCLLQTGGVFEKPLTHYNRAGSR